MKFLLISFILISSSLFGGELIPKKEITFTDIKNLNGILTKLEMEEEIEKIKERNEKLKKYSNESEYEKRLREKFEKKYLENDKEKLKN